MNSMFGELLFTVAGTHMFGEWVRLLWISAFAESTKNTLLTHGQKYNHFCDSYKLVPFPVTLPQLEDYVAYLSVELHSPEAVSGNISGLKTLHKGSGFDTGVFDNPSVQLMLKGLKRVMQHGVQQARPVTPQLLKRISHCVDKNSEEQKLVFLALLLGFHLFLRRSNLALSSVKKMNKAKLVLRGDIRVGESLTLIHVKWTKTLQFQQRPLLLPLVETADKDICPATWLRHSLRLEGNPGMLLLSHCVGPDKIEQPLLASEIQKWFRQWLIRVGESPHVFSLHSLRHGGGPHGLSVMVCRRR